MATDRRAGDSPLGRLSRFDGTTFQPVTEGSITAPFVHVFVHGWQPGFRLQERLHAVTDVVHALPAWDPRLIDPTGRTLISYYLPLLEALAELGDDHCVLYYSWLDESATDADLLQAFRSRQATQINGRRLALALQQSFARPGTRLHLIGHSHGSAVVTHAATSLGHPPEQVTLLDAPESSISRFSGAADLIPVVLPRISPGRSADRPFVDAYSTVFGRPYHRKPGLSAVVDVVLSPGRPPMRDPIRAINWAHLYAVDWYARSVREALRGVGYGWSPLRGGDVGVLASSYHAGRQQLDLHPRRERHRRKPLSEIALEQIAATAVRRNPVEEADVYLNADVPAAALVLHSVPGDGLVEFDLEIQDGDGSELIQIDVDAIPAFLAQARFPVPPSGRYVMLSDGGPGEHLLTARLFTSRPVRGRARTRVAPHVSITNVTAVNWAGGGTSSSYQHLAAVTFFAGAAAGSVATLLTLFTTGWTVHKVLNRLTRRRSGVPGVRRRPS
jgi:hypothetical protein